MTVAFDRVTINGRAYPIRATVSQALESEGIMGEKEKIGIGAGVGAILGAILGGAKGALAGILIGGGGTIAATEGKDVELPAGTVLRVRLDSPLTLNQVEAAGRGTVLPFQPILPILPSEVPHRRSGHMTFAQ